MKMSHIDVKTNTYIDFDIESNDTKPNFILGDYVKISKHENTFAKVYTPNWLQEAFVIKKVDTTPP